MPKPRSFEGGFSNADIQRLSTLVSIPSWIDPKLGINEVEVANFIFDEMHKVQGCHVWRTPTFESETGIHHDEDASSSSPKLKRHNVIVEKGTGQKIVWIIGHMDTIEPGDFWKVKNGMTIFEKKAEGGDGVKDEVFKGLGVSDMKIGLMQMMKLAQEPVPDGFKFYFMFVADEEVHSRGMRQILDNYVPHQIPAPLFVYSPEIPTLSNPEAVVKEKKKPIVIARRGSVKLRGTIQVQPGHGSQSDLVRATTEYRHVMNALFDKIENRTKLMHIHPLLMAEDFYEYDTRTRRRGMYHSNPEVQNFEIRHLTIPPTSITEVIDMYRNVLGTIARERGHAEKHVKALIQLDDVAHSYDAYQMDESHPLIQGFATSIDDINDRKNSSIFAGGASTSDMNLIAEHGYIGVETAGISAKEHADGEFALHKSAYRNFLMVRHFLRNTLPEIVAKNGL